MTFLPSIVATTLLLAGAAHAQPFQKERDVGKQRAAIAAWTTCIADEQTDRVASLLARDFTTKSYRAEMMTLGQTRVSSKCFKAMPEAYRKIELGGLPFAGGLAERLLHRDPQPLLRRLSMAALKPNVATYSRTDAIAMCVARGAPHMVAGLFATPIETAEESAALAALQPAIDICGEGQARVEATPLAMRSMLATASYGLLVAPGEAAR